MTLYHWNSLHLTNDPPSQSDSGRPMFRSGATDLYDKNTPFYEARKDEDMTAAESPRQALEWSPLSLFNWLPQISRAVESIGIWKQFGPTPTSRPDSISRFPNIDLIWKPCDFAQCCLSQGHKSCHRMWRTMCSSPECALFAGHSSPHSSFLPCERDGCIFSRGHSYDHIIPNATAREISELATDNAVAVMEDMAKLNRKVLRAMSHQDNSRVNKILLSQFLLSLGYGMDDKLQTIRLETAGRELRATIRRQERSQRLEREATEALSASTPFALKMEAIKKGLFDQRAKRERVTSKTDKPLAAEPRSAALSPGLQNPTGPALKADGEVKGSSIYENLDFSNLEIRLFQLYPSHGSDNIRGTFCYTDMSSCPDYTALSYTWGDDTNLRQIYLKNGTALDIRENLWHFLRGQSMLISRPKLFWIDAICINQSNIHERNHQVNLMRRIYAQAKHVYIWLGQDVDDSDLAMAFLDSCSKQKLKRRGLGYRSPWSRQEGRALTHLFNQPYWRRMWIIQEIIYAQDITIWCGSRSCEWSAAESLYLKMKSLEDENWQTHHEYVVQVLQSSAAVMIWQRAHWRHPDTTAPSLLTLINIFQDWQCSDIRDKVYSLIGMASKDTAVTPDYSLSAHQLYHDVIDKSSGPRSCGVLSQILGIPADELDIHKPDLIEYRRHASDKLVLKARTQADWNSGNMCLF
ncbi:hypothetical protein FPOAC2_00171 [Fusarium poae]